MASLSTFTTADEVRAVLGVADTELEDATIALPINVIQLQFDLTDIDAGLEATYIAKKEILPASRTPAEQLLVDTVQVFSAYAISRTLLTSLAAFAPARILDGKAEVERVVDPYAGVREGVLATFEALKKRVVSAYTAITGTTTATATSRSYFLAAGLNTNPVTGV